MRSDPLATVPFLQHDNADASHFLRIRLVLVIDSPVYRSTTIVVQVVVERAVAGAKSELFKEERVVVKGKSIENIEFFLGVC